MRDLISSRLGGNMRVHLVNRNLGPVPRFEVWGIWYLRAFVLGKTGYNGFPGNSILGFMKELRRW